MEFNWSIFETAFPRTDLDCRKVKYESESHLFYAGNDTYRVLHPLKLAIHQPISRRAATGGTGGMSPPL